MGPGWLSPSRWRESLLLREVYRALPLVRHLCCCSAPFSPLPLPPPTLHSKILQLGIRLFAGVSVLVLVTVLPINLTGGQVGGQCTRPGRL